jgi:NAD(P)H-nitrite reductase large subunit
MDRKQKAYLPLIQTTGSAQIDIQGLNKEDIDRIREVGLTKWMEEVSALQR